MSTDRSADAPSSMRQPLVLGLLNDLMLAVRVQATVEALGYFFRTVDALTGLEEALGALGPDVVVYDLTDAAFPLPETASLLRSRGATDRPPRVVAFFPHVMADLGRDARRVGLSVVVPRSRFMNEMAALMRGAMESDSTAIGESGLATSD